MKMKHTAALALAAWLLVTGWLASMVIAKPAVLRLGNQAEDTAAMAELRNAIGRNHKAMEGIGALRVATVPYQGSLVALPMVATNTPGMAGATASEVSAEAPIDIPEPQLSMVLDAGGRRVAVFNGEQVRLGTRLNDGSRVRAIGPDWISVSDSDGKRTTHRVRSQFESLVRGSTP